MRKTPPKFINFLPLRSVKFRRSQELPACAANAENAVNRVFKENAAYKARKVRKDFKDRRVCAEHKVYKVPKDRKDLKGRLALQDLKGILEIIICLKIFHRLTVIS
jgi:hypothetical protein